MKQFFILLIVSVFTYSTSDAKGCHFEIHVGNTSYNYNDSISTSIEIFSGDSARIMIDGCCDCTNGNNCTYQAAKIFHNGTLIGNSWYYDMKDTGNYMLTADVEYCHAIQKFCLKVKVSYKTTGISESPSNSLFTFYPQPATNEIFFNHNLSEINIYDYAGKTILHKNNPGNYINISALFSGTYMLPGTLIDGRKIYNRLLKQ